MSYTISETYTLPSKGLIYDNPINPEVTIRSMTTEEEMRRLTPSATPYKVMADIIEDCLVTKPGIHVYDMCLGDYQFLLHKLRVITYGEKYKLNVRCPHCGTIATMDINLDELALSEFDDEVKELMTVKLPQSQKTIQLRYQTPKMLDEIEKRRKEMMKDDENAVDPSLLLTLMAIIKTVDGEYIDPVKLELFVRQLPMKDTNVIIQTADKLNRKVGLDTMLYCKCHNCGNNFNTPFRITSEFFGPSID